MITKKRLIKILFIIIILIISGVIIRGIIFKKEFSIAIANETEIRIPDLTIKIDGMIAFNDSIYSSSIPCCWINRSLKFGLHTVSIESKSKNLIKNFSVLSIKNTYIYIGVWDNKNGGFQIRKKIFYFIKPRYE